MSMFRRPTDDSSDSDSASSEEADSEDLDLSNAGTDHSHAGTEEIVGADLTTAGTLSSGESISIDHSRDDAVIGDVEHVQNMMLASLLEDFYRTRAAELMNAANPGATYHRQSPEVQSLAKNLFAQASQALSSNGLLPANVVSPDVENVRQQYLAGFDTFGLQNIKNSDLLAESVKRRISSSGHSLALVRAASSSVLPLRTTSSQLVNDLAFKANQLNVIPHPANDLQITSMQPRSHYKSSFQELRLLGRGGFGRVYQTYNVFDNREYAVKKIPLSVKLSQQYREKGHSELASVLREVQALAQLDHCNVVRYHATWIEDPVTTFKPPNLPLFKNPYNGQRLIADRPAFPQSPEHRRHSSLKILSHGISDGIEFEADSEAGDAAAHPALEWSHFSNARQPESSVPDSDIFTDGMSRNLSSQKGFEDPTCYVLHVQMSMYPITLAQYLTPTSSGPRNGSEAPNKKHCFHLVPAIRILLGVMCGLQYIHGRGLIHRDIKPSNIFVSSFDAESNLQLTDGYHDVGNCPSCPMKRPHQINPRIGDFGLVADLARDGELRTGSKSSSGSAVGTEYYRPPSGNGKQAANKIDEKLDVYALGVVFVETLWRCGTNMERINLLKDVQSGNVPAQILIAIKAEGFSSEIAQAVAACIEGMIHRDHSMRWNCAKVKEHLDTILTKCVSKSDCLG